MRYVLENDTLILEIESFGAEIKSIKSKADTREYMWYADKKFWGRTSPVLFPFVGSLMNKEYTFDGRSYPMGQHGFARDMEHTLIEKTDASVLFELTSNDETLAKYPFAFVLRIGYELQGNQVKVSWQVTNPGQESAQAYLSGCDAGNDKLIFSIGAHPAFICPVHGEESKAGYRLYFEGVDEIHHHGNDVPTGMALREDIVLPLTDHRAVITPEFFDRCTYMIEGNQTGCVGIEDPQGKRFVTMHFNTPLFAIWSPEGKNAPFLCIEPWFGRCDAEDFAGGLADREFSNELLPQEQFETSYTMIFE